MYTNNEMVVLPGTFDPFTNGHMDILERALKIFDRVLVAVLFNSAKETLFSVDERKSMIKESCKEFSDRVVVESFTGLLVEYLRNKNTKIIIRGLRAISDFDYETQMALMNKSLSEEVETLFLATREANSYISSSLVKQISSLGGDVSKLVPPAVELALKEKYYSKDGEK
jgi:pantetheine-phosphate adenylyltransferase